MTLSEKILRWAVIIGVFALPFVPLIVTTSLFFPFITGKNFAFRAIVEIITCAWLALTLINPHYRPKRNWIFGTFLAFITIIAIADAQGVNPMKSFWSNFERMDGWVTIAHLFCYIVVAACVINAEKLWHRLFELSLAISVFIDLWGLAQIAGVLSLGEGGSSGWSARIDATFGNPIYLAVYMLFHIFIAALLWNRMWISRVKGQRLWLSLWYAAVIVLDTIALLFTGTRGTTFGLVGGSVLAGLIYVIFARDTRRARPYVVGGMVALAVCGGLLWLARDTTAVQNVGFLDRLVAISPTETTVASRIMNIEMAWKGIQERPILGWGQENYAIVFDKYYDPRMYVDEPWFDRVHDIVFDWWVAGGTLGLLAYLSVLCAYLWVLWRSRVFTIAERSILTGLLAGYFIHNLTVFDNITSYILFGTVLAYIVWRAGQADGVKQIPMPKLSRGMAPVAAVVALLVALGIVWLVNGKAYEANRAILGGLAQEPNGLTENLAYFQKAIAYNTYGNQEAREQLVQIASEIASATSAQVSDDVKGQFLNAAAQQMQLQEQVSPLDARFPLFLGTLLDSYGQYAAAAPALAQAHALSPSKQSILYEMGMNAQARGDTAGALNDFAIAYNLYPDDLDARIYYAAAAIEAGDSATADQVLAPIIPTGQAADSRISAAYASRKEYSKIIPIWQAYIALNPTDAQAYFTLAAAYYAGGNSAQAINELKLSETISSSTASQAQTLIQEIKNGTVQLQ